MKETMPKVANGNEGIRNNTMQKAEQYLRQGRRCDQISYRIVKGRDEEEKKRQAYRTMNMNTIKLIRRDLIKGDKEEEEFIEKVEKYKGVREEKGNKAK